MINAISKAYNLAKKESRPALLTYTVAGDSSKKQSLEILKSISKEVDILEIGVPHNTPVADGSQIQTSSYRAIKNGIKVNDIFKIVKDFKKFDKNKPVILMGYYNMIFQYGENEFLRKRKYLHDIVWKMGFKTPLAVFMDPEYNEEFDMFLYEKIGYDKLSTAVAGVFVSPYAATSLREYFATGFTEFYLHPDEHGFLQKVSPELYKKLVLLQNPEELDN